VTGERTQLPADSHVHSEWSWDAPHTSMERACRRAVELGLPSVVFTEHADFTPRRVNTLEDRIITPPPFDVTGYLKCLQACRDRFPQLLIGSGVELGEPHWHRDRVVETLARTRFDRVLVSMHMMRDAHGGRVTLDEMYAGTPAAQVLRSYLAEVLELVTVLDDFDVLAHIDYAARYWPASAGPYRVDEFKEEYRRVLAVLAAKGKTLEINTRVPLHAHVVRWWHDLKGPAVTFASDAHRPERVAHGFADAAAMAEAAGFSPTTDPNGLWTRHR
jgi:histidinol-phosphatase (PHP family)